MSPAGAIGSDSQLSDTVGVPAGVGQSAATGWAVAAESVGGSVAAESAVVVVSVQPRANRMSTITGA